MHKALRLGKMGSKSKQSAPSQQQASETNLHLHVHQVLFKLIHGSASLGQVSLFMSGLGALNLVVNTPLLDSAVLGLGEENTNKQFIVIMINKSDHLCSLQLPGHFGIVLLNPLVISVSMIFGLLLSAGKPIFP
jgi:hypothetical protein